MKPEWLTQMAETYDPEYYTACLWPDHKRVTPLGHVEALKTQQEGNVIKLFAILSPTIALIELNKTGRYAFCSIEPKENFAGKGVWYLGALGVTDEPASTGTTHMKFSKSLSVIGQSQLWANSTGNNYMNKNTPTISELLANMRMSFVPGTQSNFGNLDPSASGALRSAIVQATPFLELLTFLDVSDPTAPLFDPIKSGLRTGRKERSRFLVTADPSTRQPKFEEMDSSVIWTWRQLGQMLEGMTQEQANQALESLALSAFGDDLLRVGFHGKSAAANTDPVANPNGEDVMPGWHALAKAADENGLRVLRDAVTFDTRNGGNYADLDTMAYELVAKLPKEYRNDPRLRVLVGGDLLRTHKQAYLQPGQVRSKEQQLKIADMPVLSHQHMTGTLLAVTFTENLQIIGVNDTHRLSADDLDDLACWGIRYYRAQSYALGDTTAYAAFDSISIAAHQE
ncbi:P2 family phage major capsid protein [Aeromonas salmonicida]|uniref:P2 family phage major capsid protein n=1 Tax=Aeromonas salmonicida TaxID=645 RepID=UPI00240939B3|nr:P2 family phage major capsid protein [Aeromonas salmonicida]